MQSARDNAFTAIFMIGLNKECNNCPGPSLYTKFVASAVNWKELSYRKEPFNNGKKEPPIDGRSLLFNGRDPSYRTSFSTPITSTPKTMFSLG